MKVILLQDVPKTGKKNDVKDVAAGFAQNFLFPRKLAAVATKEAIAKANERLAADMEALKLQKELLEKNLKSLVGAKVVLNGKANDEGHLYAKIHKDEVLSAIKNDLKLDIPESAIEMEKPIDKVGETILEVVGAKGTFSVEVKAEK
jgi:large subunit ribosomal protein L9